MATSINAVSKIVKNLDITKSECSRGRISVHRSEGYRIKNTDDGIRVDYINASTSMKTTNDFLLRQYLAIEKIFIELSSDGYEVNLQWPSILIKN